MICVENEAKWFNMQWCFKSYDEWLRYQISVKENKLKNTVQINTEKHYFGMHKERFRTVLWWKLHPSKNGSERFRFRNGSERFRTVLNYLRFLVLSTKNGSERFPGRCLGACFGTCFLNIKILSWKRGLKGLKLLMKGKGSFYIKKCRSKEKRLTLCKS